MVNHITLIGVGLIGGSFVLDLKRQNLVKHVHGIDINAENLERAIERQVIDSSSTTIDSQLVHSDLIIIATPIRQFSTVLQALKPYLNKNTILTEVGSTKTDVVHLFQTQLPEFFNNYIPTHPIAGSDRSGALAAQFGLFKNKKIILCPHETQHPASFELIKNLWKKTGAQIEELSTIEHDKIFASVSHLPHLLAFSYINQIAQQQNQEECFHFAGSGFRDFTRIASSDPSVWTDIALENEQFLIELIEKNQQELVNLYTMLKNKDQKSLHQYFSQAKQKRDLWLKKENLL